MFSDMTHCQMFQKVESVLDMRIHQVVPKIYLFTYLFKNLSKSRLSDPFFGLFLVICEVGSQIYIANLAIFSNFSA